MILATLLTWTLLGQAGGGFSGPSPLDNPSFTTAFPPGSPTFAGSTLDLADAEEEAHTIVTGRPTSVGGPMLQGTVLMATCDVKCVEAWKGRVPQDSPARFGLTAVDGEILPGVDEDYVFFLARRRDADVIIKVIPATPANLVAVRQVIQAAEDRQLPNSQLPIGEARAKAHTIVVAEATGEAVTASGGVGLGWCDLKVKSALKGEAKAVDGKRIGYVARGGGRPPTIGRPYLFFIGKDRDLDTILKVEPATKWGIDAITRAEANLRAIRAGAARRVPGASLTIAEAEAKAHTIVVGEVQYGVEAATGGFGTAVYRFRVATALKGAAKPGDRIGPAYQPPDRGVSPQVGESFLVFVGKADKQDLDEAVKFLPATPENIQATRDHLKAAGPPVVARGN